MHNKFKLNTWVGRDGEDKQGSDMKENTEQDKEEGGDGEEEGGDGEEIEEERASLTRCCIAHLSSL